MNIKDKKTKYKTNIMNLENALEYSDTLFILNEQIKFQENLNNERQQLAKQAKYDNTIEIARSMKNEGDSIEKISRITGLTQEEIDKL